MSIDRTTSTPTILASGGENPRIVWVSADGNILRQFALQGNDAVYALAIGWGNELAEDTSKPFAVFAGTRSGRLCVWRFGDQLRAAREGNRDESSAIIAAGAPVTAVSAINASCLISGDSEGRILIWDVENLSAAPVALPASGHRVAALLPLADGRIAGLDDQGELRVWSMADPASPVNSRWELVFSIQGPAPAQPTALTRLL
jgi:hypothetical protein